jgi:glycosyltransferase involved in cell wall biosynthesis
MNFLFSLIIFLLSTSSFLNCSETVYALMITGKDDYHHKLALSSIKSFQKQTYPNKKLIIVNDGQYSYESAGGNVQEIKIEKGKVLGELRNISLDAVPEGSVWVQWDDDDWHHPNLIQTQYDALNRSNALAVMLGKQIYYSCRINSAWVRSHYSGIMGTIMCRNTTNVRYPAKKKAEDASFLYQLRKRGKVININNPPEYYIRLIHGHNTWGENHFDVRKRNHNTFYLDDETEVRVKKYLYNFYPYLIRNKFINSKSH